jgi:hypothetical protein
VQHRISLINGPVGKLIAVIQLRFHQIQSFDSAMTEAAVWGRELCDWISGGCGGSVHGSQLSKLWRPGLGEVRKSFENWIPKEIPKEKVTKKRKNKR